MDLRHAIGEHVTEGRELLERLRSTEEGSTATDMDLHILRVQLFLLDNLAANMLELRRSSRSPDDTNPPRMTRPTRPPSRA